jgi:hypothetical protein
MLAVFEGSASEQAMAVRARIVEAAGTLRIRLAIAVPVRHETRQGRRKRQPVLGIEWKSDRP